MKHNKKHWINFSYVSYCFEFEFEFVEPPIIAYPDHNKEFILHGDSSDKGLGAVILKYQEVDLRVISYGSRTLIPAEKKYHSSKPEFLGIKWAVCNQFRNYLYYAPHFHIYTNYNPVT